MLYILVKNKMIIFNEFPNQLTFTKERGMVANSIPKGKKKSPSTPCHLFFYSVSRSFTGLKIKWLKKRQNRSYRLCKYKVLTILVVI